MALARPPAPPLRPRGLLGALSLFAFLGAASCGSKPPPPPSSVVPSGDTVTCPAPVGTIPREDCTAIAEDFGALTLSGALHIAGTGRESEVRVEAIRAATALANSLKDQRVKLCDLYNRCKVPVADHADKDQVLASGMRALIDLWNKRNFARTEEIVRFREGVRAIDARVNGTEVKATPPKNLKAEEALASIEGAGLTFKHEGGAVTVTATGAGERPVLRGRPEAMPFLADRHYRVKVTGTFSPSEPPLIQAGEEIVTKLRYRATQPGDLIVAIRSLEDPDAIASTAWSLKAGETGSREVTLAAEAQLSGYYVGVSLKGDGASVDLDDIEISRGGKSLAVARAEGGDEPFVKHSCLVIGEKPLAGKSSLRCQAGEGDRVTIGMPSSNLALVLRSPASDRATLRTASLDGGRSVDAAVGQDGEFVIRMTGAGTATIKTVEISEISAPGQPAVSGQPAQPAPATP